MDRLPGARPGVRHSWVQVLLATLGLLIVVLALLDHRARGGEHALELSVEEAAPASPARAGAVLLPPEQRSDELDSDPESGAASRGTRVEAAPEADLRQRDEPPAPEPEPPPRAPEPKSEEAIFSLRIYLRPEAGDVPSRWEDASITARFAGTAADYTVNIPLNGNAVIEVPRKATQPLPSACEVVVSHPGYCLHRATLDMERVHREGRDAEGRARFGIQHFARLQRYSARVHGRTDGADRAALVVFSAGRTPEPLEIVDITGTRDGEYSLRVPRSGEWAVVALKADHHPVYAIIDVPPSVEAGVIAEHFVSQRLRPLDTELRIDAIVPAGYDPTGLAVVLKPYVECSEAIARAREDAAGRSASGGLPALAWHRTGADPPAGGGWGIDLRRPEPEAERRDSIVWLRSSATLDGAGGALVRGGPTGAGLTEVQDPFQEGRWEPGEARHFGARDTARVTPPVARIDVLAFDAEGTLVGGTAHAEWGAERGAGGRAARPGRSTGDTPAAQRGGPEASSGLDSFGRAALFVPSLASLKVTVLDSTGARSAVRRTPAPPPGGSFAVVLTVTAHGSPTVDGAGVTGKQAERPPD